MNQFTSFNPVCYESDKVSITLANNMKVYIRGDSSIMVKNCANFNCMAVAGAVELNETRRFSVYRHEIKLHHDVHDALHFEIVDSIPDVPATYTGSVFNYDGDYCIRMKISDHPVSDLSCLFKTCDEVFQGRVGENLEVIQSIALWLKVTCRVDIRSNGLSQFIFENGVHVTQFPSGRVTVFSTSYPTTMVMHPTHGFEMTMDNTTIISNNSMFTAKKGTAFVTTINNFFTG